MILCLLKIENMNKQEKIKFKKSWDNYLERRFWEKLSKQSRNLELIYPFSFCSLRSEIRYDENGMLYLCFLFEEREKSGNEKIDNERSINIKTLKDIFISIFDKDNNEKYIGFYRLSKKENFKDFLRALFILGNEIEDEELKDFLLDGETKIIFEKLKSTILNVDELFENYINEIVEEFEGVAIKVNEEIYKNFVFFEFADSFLKMFPVFEKRN